MNKCPLRLQLAAALLAFEPCRAWLPAIFVSISQQRGRQVSAVLLFCARLVPVSPCHPTPHRSLPIATPSRLFVLTLLDTTTSIQDEACQPQ